MSDGQTPPMLWAELADRRFGPTELEELRAQLLRQDGAVVLLPLDDVDQIRLLPNAVTARGGYRLSRHALGQICSLLAAGLAALLADLTGDRLRAGYPGLRGDVGQALDVYNRLLQHRFACVSGSLLLVDQQSRIIEGVLGTGYRRLANAVLLDQVEACLSVDAVFMEARLCGRALSFYWLQDQAPLLVGLGDDYRCGIYVSNSEMGDRASRADPAVMRCRDRTWLLAGGAAAAPVHHSGKDYPQRWSRALSSAVAFSFDGDRLVQQLQQLGGKNLGFAGPAGLGTIGPVTQHERRSRTLAQAFARRQLPLAFGQRCVRAALLRSAADAPDAPQDPLAQQDRRQLRTHYDLLAALMREASALAPSLREKAEKLAYDLATANWRLPAAGGQETGGDT